MKTKFLLPLLLRLTLGVALLAAALGGLEALELASRPEGKAATTTDVALAGLASVPVAAPWVLQVTALLRGR